MAVQQAGDQPARWPKMGAWCLWN